MEGNPPAPPQRDDVEDEEELDANDAVEIIELEEGDGLDEGVDGLDLQEGLNDEDGEIIDQDTYEEDELEAVDDMEIEDDSKVSFQKHTGSVFCVSLHPADQTMAISGKWKRHGLLQYMYSVCSLDLLLRSWCRLYFYCLFSKL